MERVEKGNGGDRRAAFSSLTRLGPSVTPSLIPTSTLHLRFRAGGEVMGDQGNQEATRPRGLRVMTTEPGELRKEGPYRCNLPARATRLPFPFPSIPPLVTPSGPGSAGREEWNGERNGKGMEVINRRAAREEDGESTGCRSSLAYGQHSPVLSSGYQ